MRFTLYRFCKYPATGRNEAATISRVQVGDVLLGWGIEQAYRNNEPFVSCVPDGSYRLIPFDSPKFGPTFIMVNEELGVYAHESDMPNPDNRYLCLFPHIGNYAKDVQGCVALGSEPLINGGGAMVTRSGGAMDEFRDLVPMDEEHELLITSVEQDYYGNNH